MKNILFIILTIFIFISICYSQADSIKVINDNQSLLNKVNQISYDIKSIKDKSTFLNILYIILSGFIGICSALLIARYTRKTEFDKYLYQRRIEFFTKFLTILDKCKKDINGIILVIQVDKHNKINYNYNEVPNIIKDIFEPLVKMKFPIKLILSNKYRNLFDKTLNKLAELTMYSSISEFKENKLKEIEALINELETILTSEIDSLK